MFIQTEQTPNPATLKFLPNVPVLPDSTANFSNPESAEASPLASALFSIAGVCGVFFGADFVSVTKEQGSVEWRDLKPQVLTALMAHFTSGDPLMTADVPMAMAGPGEDDPLHADIIAQIRELIDSKVRPAVARDGGDIVYRGFQAGVVYLHMQGSCSGCPSSSMTLKSGIENLLKHYVPEVVEVRAI